MRRQPGFSVTLPVILAVILTILALVAGCTGTAPAHAPVSWTSVSEDPGFGSTWKQTALTDLHGRGNFSIGTFAGKTVLISPVSVSCPACIVQLQRQLYESGRLEQQHPDRIKIVSLDLDPDTGPGFMAAYGDAANFTGYSARSPQALTLAILHRFGPFAIDTETIPVILVCPDGRDQLLPTGVKAAEDLNETISREC
jgi:cytochrome oxidase Cu insertion factor (SCO1/SenC/PrrC family)